jgi:hypothetical protein
MGVSARVWLAGGQPDFQVVMPAQGAGRRWLPCSQLSFNCIGYLAHFIAQHECRVAFEWLLMDWGC